MNRETLIRLIASILVLLVLATIIGGVVHFFSKDEVPTPRGNMSQGFGALKRVVYDGKNYVHKSSVTTIALLGVDRAEGTVRKGYRDGGQADFILLLAIDSSARTVHMLHIDRDAMTNITVLGILGQEVGTSYAQICLSHGFGATEEENCEYTLKAISNLLEGEDIDLYLSCDMSFINEINDLLGGVTVTLNEDFTSLDPAMKKGQTLTLKGPQAEYFVRSRYTIADGSNAKRMERQRIFLDAVKDTLITRAHADSGFANDFINSVWDKVTSKVGIGRVVNLFSSAVTYEILPIETLPGEHIIGKDGFVEYHVNDNAAVNWVLNTLYKPE